MSSSMYRNTIVRLTKEKATLDKQVSDETAKVARYESEIAQITRSISSNPSLSTLRSKQQQIEMRQRPLVQAQKRAADYAMQSSRKLEEINRNMKGLAQAEEQERQRQDQDNKKRRQEEIRHSRELTREIEHQAKLHAELAQHKYVINLAALPQKITVLFLASNPIDQQPLRLDEEVRAITTKIRASEYRDAVELEHAWAARPSDILQALNEHRPHVVHFSGHGSAGEEIILQSDAGTTKPVSKDAIAATMATMADNISLVVFNACFSTPQAEAVTEHIGFAIGMDDALGDEAARIFAAQFYSAIGFGRSIKQAFDQGVAALKLEGIPEDRTPKLFWREDRDPSEVILVRPAANLEDVGSEALA